MPNQHPHPWLQTQRSLFVLAHNLTEYRGTLESLQYLTLTRLDVAFVVNKSSQFIHMPRSAHWFALKRLLWYLDGTSHKGINIYRDFLLSLRAFSDLTGKRTRMILIQQWDKLYSSVEIH